MRSFKERGGFAIPTAILVVALLTASVAAGFAMVSIERRSVEDQKSSVTAFAIAQQGLETFMLKRDSLGLRTIPPGVRDSVRITFPGGYADVVSIRLKVTVNNQKGIYVIRSQGVETSGLFSTTPRAIRTVAQLAQWIPASMQVLSGWTSLSGLKKNGAAGAIRGADACGDSTTRSGVVVGTEDGYIGNISPVTGSPAIDTVPMDSVRMDWAGISAGTAFTPTVVIPPDSWPTFADTSVYPVILVKNGYGADYAIPTEGRGTLIIQGNGTINGSIGWTGVVLIGGKLTANNGGGVVNGAIVSGLNEKLAQVPDPSYADANGTKTYNYNSCAVAKAMATLGSFIPMTNTWVDNWVKY